MDDSLRRPSGGRHHARRTAPLAATLCLLVACTAEPGSQGEAEPSKEASSPGVSTPGTSPSGNQSGTDEGGSPSPGPTPEQTAATAAPAPSVIRAPAPFAQQLHRAVATVLDPDVTGEEVRRAAELHQLAVRDLASRPAAFRRRVLVALPGPTEQVVRGDLRATESLRAMTDPERKLPRWRIVAPPAPQRLLRYYRVAERRSGAPWHYLAAIHLVETRMGRIRGTSSAGAVGPMQFLPTTWDLYGEGGDINDPQDAILAAGRLLRRHGAPGDMANALWHYNPSTRYVRAVTAYAATMEGAPRMYRGYWNWQVLYRHVRGTYVLPVGYPEKRPRLVARD